MQGEHFDGRIILKDVGAISPGESVYAPIKFLYSTDVRKLIFPGTTFEIWEMGIIGKGKIVEILESE